MKTFKKMIEPNKLEIVIDDSPESPRTWENLGKFISCDTRRTSPDNDTTLLNIVKLTGTIATNTEDHIKLIKKEIEKNGDEVFAIYPVSTYEHASITFKLYNYFGCDYSNNSFYIITKNDLRRYGIEASDTKKVEGIIEEELKTYTKWANGEVYGFILYDDQGDVLDSCYGFYDIADIKDYLPEEWENEDLTDYVTF